MDVAGAARGDLPAINGSDVSARLWAVCAIRLEVLKHQSQH
jgi:hypothetical protein